MNKVVSLILMLPIMLAIAGSLFGCLQYQAPGVNAGISAGGAAEALSVRNFWRGGIIGGPLKAVTNADLDDISEVASQDVAAGGYPSEYRTEDSSGIFRADPLSYDKNTKCRTIRERAWENKKLVLDQTKEVCQKEELGER